MEKKTISVHAVTIHVYTIVIAVLLVALAVVGVKYVHLKFAVHQFTQSAIFLNTNQQPAGTISDYGKILATTIINYPVGNILLHDPANLESYVVTLSKELNRDVVVIDPSRKILADTFAANVGGNYAYDATHEIDGVLQDGMSRTFIEKSTDYPQGIAEVAVPIKTPTNQIVGVVLISNTTIAR